MNSQTSKAILGDLYRRYNITNDQALEIVKSQFRVLLKKMAEYSLSDENYPTIRLMNFGLFFVKPGKKVNYGNKE